MYKRVTTLVSWEKKSLFYSQLNDFFEPTPVWRLEDQKWLSQEV